MLIGGEGTDYQKFVDSINSIKNATDELRQEVPEFDEEAGDKGVSGNIISFSEFGSDEMPEGEMPEGDDELPEGDDELPEGDDELPEGDDELPEGDEEDSNIKDFGEFLGKMQDETETDEEAEEEKVDEEKDWNLPEPPKELKNINHIKTFKEMSFKQKNDFIKDPENKKMPKGKIDPNKGSSTESTIVGKKGLNKKDDLRQKVDNTKMSKKSADDTKGGKKTDSGAKVDVKYFSGKGKQPKKQANKKGSDVENFSDWTKRI